MPDYPAAADIAAELDQVRAELAAERTETRRWRTVALALGARLRALGASSDSAAEEQRELERWRELDQRTVVSQEPQRIALEDLREHEPYAGWDVSDVDGGEG